MSWNVFTAILFPTYTISAHAQQVILLSSQCKSSNNGFLLVKIFHENKHMLILPSFVFSIVFSQLHPISHIALSGKNINLVNIYVD